MKKIMFAVIIGLFVMSACNHQAKDSNQETDKTAKAEKHGVDIKLAALANKKDDYCGMDLEEGAIGDTANYQGKIYGFCSKECKEGFLENPSKYLSQQ